MPEATALSHQHTTRIRSVFLFIDQEIRPSSLTVLNQRGQIPLFLLVPSSAVDIHRSRFHSLGKVFVYAWEELFKVSDASLQQAIETELGQAGLDALPDTSQEVPPEVWQKKIRQRLAEVNTLPTLPEIALRLMQLLKDPQTTVEELETLLSTDPAIVHRLLQVISTPIFTGTSGRKSWTLKEAIVRLGLKQVGSLAQQIKLINAFVRPEGSAFDLRRFWEHSVGCALIAERLCSRQILSLPEPVAFDRYWIAALLHDLGKLILGFFFWPHFEQILKKQSRPETPFHWVETRLGHEITHEYLGQLLLERAQVEAEVVEAVATHNSTGRRPGTLVCLIHVADNLCKDLGLGYLPHERGNYNSSVLATVKLTVEDMGILKTGLEETIVEDIQDVVHQCISE
ncbi:MAG: HDOD domain-containing protein [Gemmatimonadetes bacterium]|nr:HDOD domain-containing protein [Gemmatimonadota bacterium]